MGAAINVVPLCYVKRANLSQENSGLAQTFPVISSCINNVRPMLVPDVIVVSGEAIIGPAIKDTYLSVKGKVGGTAFLRFDYGIGTAELNWN